MEKDLFTTIVLDMSCTDEEWEFVSDTDIISRIQGIDDLEQKDRDGRTLLINAACYGRADVVNYLLRRGSDVCAKDNLGFSVLHAGVMSNDIKTVKSVLEAGADANEKNQFGNTPVMVANLLTDLKIFRVLIDNGADPDQKNNYGISAFDMFSCSADILTIFRNKTGKTG